MSKVSNCYEKQIDRIIDALRDLEYGSILILVHDSKIVQIERTEKIRVSLLQSNKPFLHKKPLTDEQINVISGSS